jgi:dihydropteroate synthase
VTVIEGIRAHTAAPLSIDTRKASVARAAVEAGADVVNDVTAGRFDPEMLETVAACGAGAILMHMKGVDPARMQDDLAYGHLLGDIAAFLGNAAEQARAAGVAADAVAVDPGLGFGKAPEDNLLLLRHLPAFASLGCAVVVGASRKGFVRRFSGVSESSPSAERLAGSLAALSAAAAGGAAILRAHDVADSIRFLKMAHAVARAESPSPATAGSPSTSGSPSR